MYEDTTEPRDTHFYASGEKRKQVMILRRKRNEVRSTGSMFSGPYSSESASFDKDAAVIAASAQYLKAYAIDTLLTSFLFCFIGYFNGTGNTLFVMLQGIIGAFGVRLPVSWFVSRQAAATLFHIGLATPASSLVQIILCGMYFAAMVQKQRRSQKSH